MCLTSTSYHLINTVPGIHWVAAGRDAKPKLSLKRNTKGTPGLAWETARTIDELDIRFNSTSNWINIKLYSMWVIPVSIVQYIMASFHPEEQEKIPCCQETKWIREKSREKTAFEISRQVIYKDYDRHVKQPSPEEESIQGRWEYKQRWTLCAYWSLCTGYMWIGKAAVNVDHEILTTPMEVRKKNIQKIKQREIK